MGRPRKSALSPAQRHERVIAYIRVSTQQQARSGLGLDAQRATLRSELVRMGIDPDDENRVLWLVEDGASAKTLNRPKMQLAGKLLADGQASMLMATKIDRVSRSIVDFIELMNAAEREGWRLVITSMNLDTSNAMGRFVARIIAEVAELERELIAERTRDALQAKKATGAQLGSPEHKRIPAEVVARIVLMRNGGATYEAICAALMAAKVPTARGKSRWFPSTVQAVLDRVAEEADGRAGRVQRAAVHGAALGGQGAEVLASCVLDREVPASAEGSEVSVADFNTPARPISSKDAHSRPLEPFCRPHRSGAGKSTSALPASV